MGLLSQDDVIAWEKEHMYGRRWYFRISDGDKLATLKPDSDKFLSDNGSGRRLAKRKKWKSSAPCSGSRRIRQDRPWALLPKVSWSSRKPVQSGSPSRWSPVFTSKYVQLPYCDVPLAARKIMPWASVAVVKGVFSMWLHIFLLLLTKGRLL